MVKEEKKSDFFSCLHLQILMNTLDFMLEQNIDPSFTDCNNEIVLENKLRKTKEYLERKVHEGVLFTATNKNWRPFSFQFLSKIGSL